MPDFARELALLVMEWWEDHKRDSVGDGDYSEPVYDEVPALVLKAKEIIGDWEKLG